MATPKLSILTFPQRFEAGKLYFNILILPRNINPLVALEPGFPAFADAAPAFKAMIINSLDGLPLTGSVTHQPDALLIDPALSSRTVWDALQAQIAATDNLKIDDAATADVNNQAPASIDKYKNVAIRKYLPQSYRASFNFTKPRTRYALTGDEYHCSVKNSGAPTDTRTDRDKISWGKAIALCLRNPLLAKKAGLIFEAQVDVPAGVFDEGGWIYIDMGTQSPWATLNNDLKKHYAARIPALKGLAERTLFAAVQFPVSDVVAGNAGYDEIMREALVYDDGFAKVVHANQPLNDYLLEEEDKSNPPQKDIGIRLGWDDEQLTIWQNRQMLQKEENTGEFVDAPLGVFSYCIDARKEGEPDWRSQNSIVAPGGMSLNNDITIAGAGAKIEMGSEVHPAAHGSSATEGFWLPMYFTNWMGKSLAIPDKDAQDIYQTKASEIKPATSRYTDPEYYKGLDKTPPYTDLEIDQLIANYKKSNTVQTVPKATFNPYIQNADDVLALEYGHTYDFRIRLMDLSGGAPLKTKTPLHGSQKPVANWHFIRHTAASAIQLLNIQDTLENQGELSDDNRLTDTSMLENIVDKDNPVLHIRRPGLAYPAVVFTGKYQNPDAITRLKAILQNLPADPKQSPLSITLPDPDVDRFKVLVEMKSLEMDNALSLKGNEPFIKLYEKFYDFGTDRDEDFALRITYKDHAELPFDESFAIEGGVDELSLPSARHLRLTFIPVVTDADNIYADDSILFGKPIVISSYKVPIAEPGLLTPVDEGIKAFFLQPEGDGFVKPAVNAFGYTTTYLEKQIKKSSTPVELERIADALNITANNLTLEGLKGERTQFGCTKQMRHSLAPDSSSITFSSLAEVFNHWVIAVNYTLQRDWTWDGLKVNSFLVSRQVSNKSGNLGDKELVGLIKVSRTANINALSNAQRDHTNLIFLDTLDPKDYNQEFPEELFVTYTFEQKLASAASVDDLAPVTVNLPVTTIPAQIPKLVSVGLALSPYEYDEKKYDATNTRQKFIWLEFDEPPLNNDDTYYIRVLANSPDPMLCTVNKSLVLDVPEEPPLNINLEKIRIIIPGMDNDFAGVGAMQEMISEQIPAPRFYMVPLPAGLHTESDELFGFFSCEIRLGHKKELWSTAQGRYGRPLKVNGVQHPAPALFCNTSRRKSANPALPINEIVITAPFANAVHNGKNVAALPPQTSLWSFLYTQVKQADGKAYRNILLASRPMRYKRAVNQADDGNRYGLCSFNQTEVSSYLRAIGLPVSSGLSVLCVEMYPLLNRWRIDNRAKDTDVRRLTDEEKKLRERATAAGNADFAASFNLQPISYTGELLADDDIQVSAHSAQEDYQQVLNPLVEGLGKYRIYRTSALVPVENICCDDC